MTRVTIFHSPRYDLVSVGNGVAYELHDNELRISAFVQSGDDAAAFRAEFDSFPEDLPLEAFCEEQLAIRL